MLRRGPEVEALTGVGVPSHALKSCPNEGIAHTPSPYWGRQFCCMVGVCRIERECRRRGRDKLSEV